MKKLFALIILVLFFVTSSTSTGVFAAGKKTSMTTTLTRLTKKIYARGLFSPQDTEALVDIKMSLDSAMLMAPDPTFAPLYYNLGVIYEKRKMTDDAVECFQTILENFGDTALGPKARNELTKMGVTIKLPTLPGDSAGEAAPME